MKRKNKNTALKINKKQNPEKNFVERPKLNGYKAYNPTLMEQQYQLYEENDDFEKWEI